MSSRSTSQDGGSTILEDKKTMLEDPRLPSLPPELTSIQVGIWRVLFERNPTSSTSSTTPDKRHKWSWTDLLIQPLALLPILYQQARKMLEDTHLPRLIMDVHALGPGLFWIMVMSYALTGVEDALLLWLNNRVFALVRSDLSSCLVELMLRLDRSRFEQVFAGRSGHCTGSRISHRKRRAHRNMALVLVRLLPHSKSTRKFNTLDIDHDASRFLKHA